MFAARKKPNTMPKLKVGRNKFTRGGYAVGKPTPLDFLTTENGRIESDEFCRLENLYNHSASCQAARVILHSQLMSGGLQFTRMGKRVRMTNEFTTHIQKFWEPFATNIIDSFLKWGLCPVTLEEEEGCNAQSHTVPYVPDTGTFYVSWTGKGKRGFRRQYSLRSVDRPADIDSGTAVHIRQPPDKDGNLNSPVSTVAPMCEFVEALQRLAEEAEHSRAAPSIVTQLRNRTTSTGLDSGALFYDTETRNMNTSNTERESTEAARALQAQARICQLINESQTRRNDEQTGIQRPLLNQGLPPRLFTLPKDHEVAPHTTQPQTRTDLEALMRLTSQSIAASMGVPSSLILESRHTAASSQQLHLLNATVSQLASSVASILTQTYCCIYGEKNPVEVELNTKPMIDSSDLLSLYTSGLIDVDTALPSALTLLGASPFEIDDALARAASGRQNKAVKSLANPLNDGDTFDGKKEGESGIQVSVSGDRAAEHNPVP